MNLQPWDLAAVKVVEEAGGRFTDFDERATIHGRCAIASNGLVDDEVRELIRVP